METNRDYDILEMPLQALAAYWLSIKKLMDSKKNKSCVEEEAAHTSEPFIKHLLETGLCSGLAEPLVRKLALVKRDVLLSDYHRKIDLMRLALYAIASGENPRVTLVRMLSKFAVPPLDEEQAFDLARGLMTGLAEPAADKAALVNVDHKMRLDQLLVKLLFYAIYARHESIKSLARFLPHVTSPYFAEGLSLAVDSFEPDFLTHHLASIRDETIYETKQKMDLAMEMCLAIKNKQPYEDIHAIARSYMP